MNVHQVPVPFVLMIAAVSGFFTDWAFPDRNLWGLAFVGIAGLWLATWKRHSGVSFVAGWVWGLAFFLPHIRWAEYAVGGALPWVALSVVQGLYIGVFAWAWSFAARSRFLRGSFARQSFAFATLWVAVEYLRMTTPFGGFPWGRLGFSQSESPIARLAWLGGIPLTSFAVALIGALLGVLVLGLIRLNLVSIGSAGLGAVIMLASGFLIPLDTQAQQGMLTVGGVQGNVENPGLGAFANRQEVLNNHVAGTHQLAGQPGLDLVVWPENGTDIDPQADAGAAALIDAAARDVGVPVLLGAQEYPDSGGRYNVSLLWQEGQGVTGRYVKQHPVPFGEYIPFRDFFRRLSPAVDLISTDMLPGEQPSILDVPIDSLDRDVRVSPIICFEVGYDNIIYDAVKRGGEVLIVQTNNASFGHTNESTQQLAMSRLRAIETGRAVIHVSTVGVSAVYTPHGVEKVRTGHFTAEQFVQRVALRTSLTPAVRLGIAPTVVAGGASVLLVVTGIIDARHRSRTRGLLDRDHPAKKRP